MKRVALTLVVASLAVVMGCSNDSSDQLLGGGGGPVARDPNGTGGGQQGEEHNNDPGAAVPGESPTQPSESQPNQQVGSAEVISRLHACGKIQYAAFGTMLSTRGVNVANNTANSAGLLYRNGGASLGVANYQGRVPEATFHSTASMAKQMDILVAAATEMQANLGTSTGCQGVSLQTGGVFTKDGISCLIGKPAKDEHVALANQAVTSAPDQTTGIRIAIAALLNAAHTCE
jgi:hypothetical protein